MVKFLSKYAAVLIRISIRDEQSESGFKDLVGHITSFKDKNYIIYEINFLTEEYELYRNIKVDDILLLEPEI